VINPYYVAVLGLALFGATTLAGRPAAGVALLLPLAFLVAVAVIAEGNARYHVNGLALLATLAGRGVASRPKVAGLVVLGAVALASWASVGLVLAPLVLVGILLVAAVGLILDNRARIRSMRSSGALRRPLLVVVAAGVVGSQLALAGVLLASRQMIIDWSLTQPAGWVPYRSNAAGPLDGGRIAVRVSDVPTRFRKVSFPDAVVLTYPSSARAGETIGLTRTFPGLEVGATYVVYLQVLAPAPTAGGDRLAVRLNGHVVWQPPVGPTSQTGWQDVIVPWTADSPFALIQVERSAEAPLMAPEVLIRSVHVYPRY
jgi:hypothetical protein